MKYGEFTFDGEIPDYGQSPWTRTDPVALAGASIGVLVLMGIFLSVPSWTKMGTLFENQDSANTEPFEYVEARLLKWGEIKEQDAMPDRIVPALPTAPEEIIPLDRDSQKPPPTEEAPKKDRRQVGAVDDDKLRKVFDKARAFAEIQDDFIPEGHPDGVPDGDVTDPALASIGQTYGRRITQIIGEYFIIPTLLSESEKNRLKAKILLKFDIDMQIVDFKFVENSGNPIFDNAIQNAVDRVRKNVKKLPPPPEAIAHVVFGGGIVIKMHGKDSQ